MVLVRFYFFLTAHLVNMCNFIVYLDNSNKHIILK